MFGEQFVAALCPQIVFGRVLVAHALAAFGWLRHFPVIARVGIWRLERQSIVHEDAHLDELAVAVQAIPFHDVQLLGVHPAIGAEPRLRVESDDVDDERVVAFEMSAGIAVEGQRDIPRMRRVQINPGEPVLIDG